MQLLNQSQTKDDYKYKITDLIEASKELKVFKIKVADIFLHYQAPNENSLTSFIDHCRDTMNANLKYPIILAPDNFILDGKHRVAKAIIKGKKYVKAVRFEEMPDCGEYIGD